MKNTTHSDPPTTRARQLSQTLSPQLPGSGGPWSGPAAAESEWYRSFTSRYGDDGGSEGSRGTSATAAAGLFGGGAASGSGAAAAGAGGSDAAGGAGGRQPRPGLEGLSGKKRAFGHVAPRTDTRRPQGGTASAVAVAKRKLMRETTAGAGLLNGVEVATTASFRGLRSGDKERMQERDRLAALRMKWGIRERISSRVDTPGKS
jgi:hypothetical protein